MTAAGHPERAPPCGRPPSRRAISGARLPERHAGRQGPRKTFRWKTKKATGSSGLRFSHAPLAPARRPGGALPKEARPEGGPPKLTGGLIMGNRAVITTKERELALYLHWNGGRDTVEPLLRY